VTDSLALPQAFEIDLKVQMLRPGQSPGFRFFMVKVELKPKEVKPHGD